MASGNYKFITVDGKTVPEHRYIVEQFIGRKLKSSEHVHHINRDPSDNHIDNLQIVSNSEHARLHGKDHLEKRTGKKTRLNVLITNEQMDYLKSLPVSISSWLRLRIHDAIREEKIKNVSASASVSKIKE